MADDKSTSSDTAMGLFWIGLVLVALFFLFWKYQGEMIMSTLRWIRYGELWLVMHIINPDTPIVWKGEEIPVKDVLSFIGALAPHQVTNEVLTFASLAGLSFYRWIFVVILIGCAIWAYYRGPESENRTRHNILSLMKRQVNTFPVIKPFIDFDPSKLPPRPPGAPVPAKIPLFAEALGPEEWIAFNTITGKDNVLNPDATERAFAKQLGPRWKGAKNLAPYKQILLASFCLKASRKRNEADVMLGRLAACWTHKKGLNLGEDRTLLRDARKVLSNKSLSQNTLALCNQHAWQTTALMRALWHARSEGGVLAPAMFVWLRGHDRALWYPLNNLGRNSYHLEALGAICHYKAEKMAQRPIPRPKVQNAVGAITEYMESDMARPIPQMDYTGSGERGIKKMKTA